MPLWWPLFSLLVAVQALSCCGRHIACWLGNHTKPSFLWTTSCAHSCAAVPKKCSLWLCFSSAPFQHRCPGRKRSSRTVWCGWEINFSHKSIQLMSSKLAKLASLIKALLSQKRVLRKTRKRCIGLLIWATSVALHLRSCFVCRPQQPSLFQALHPTNRTALADACAEADVVGVGGGCDFY